MARKKRPSAGPGAARFRAAAALDKGKDDDMWGNAPSRHEVAAAKGFSLKDEARNTRHSAWGRVEKLRSKPVSFVSAGMIEPLKELPRDVEENASSQEVTMAVKDLAIVDDEFSATTSDVQAEKDPSVSPQQRALNNGPPLTAVSPSLTATSSTKDGSSGDANPAVAPPEPQVDLGFVIDLTGDKKLSAKVASQSTPKIPERHSSPEDSDSSAEVILFRGRGNPSRSVPPPKAPKAPKAPNPPKPHTTPKTPQIQPPQEVVPVVETIETTIHVVEATPNPVVASTSPARPPSASLNRFDAVDQGRKPKDTGMDLDKLLQSDEEQAIIDDYIANMVSDSEGENDSVFGPLLRNDLGALDMDMGGKPWAVDASDDDSAASDDDEDSDDAELEEALDQALRSRDSEEDAGPSMDDETLARLLAKQEELGMGSDELILLGGQETSFVHSSRKARDRARKEAKIMKNMKSTSAATVADAFDALDIMDWDRPSLANSRKGGGRQKKPFFDAFDDDVSMSDSDDLIEQRDRHLQRQWQKDRDSKKAKKLQREELRAQGLLGKHANPDDPRHKYPLGMTLDDIKIEMRDFLEGDASTLQLPPMDKHSRKVLHELAQKFKVKSVSTGSGNQRRPTLTRTKYTVKYVEAQFEMHTSRVERKHFPRLDLKGKGKASSTTKIRRGAGTAAVTYMEGEVVGASAKELGQENKGRNMLEKMGWSMGMALGSIENKGILQPVAQVVKRSKAGLG